MSVCFFDMNKQMARAPVFDVDLVSFKQNPYPILENMRLHAPIAYVPALDAILITKLDDIFSLEKKIEIFSSNQPESLMTRLMGQNMMRKDGLERQMERKAIFPTLSPKAIKNVWRTYFENSTRNVIDQLKKLRQADIFTDFAMPVLAKALKALTGLTNMSWQEMDRVSQGIIDRCSNYVGDP